MPRISSKVEDQKVIQNVPKHTYPAHIHSAVTEVAAQTGNPMIRLHFMIDEGEYSGRILPPGKGRNVMTGGKTKDGRPMPIFDIRNLLESFQIPWECESCHNGLEVRKFHVSDGTDGLEKGQIVCPDCKSPRFDFSYNCPEDFIGKRALIAVDEKKAENSDMVFNTVERFASLP